MIQILNNQIDRDGETIGTIIDGTAYIKAKLPPVIVGQIRKAAGNPELRFEIADTPEEKAKVETISAQTETPKSSQTITGSNEQTGSEMPVPDKAAEPSSGEAPMIGVPNPIWDISTFPDYATEPKKFAQCFINTYGPDEFSLWQKQNA